MSDDLCVTSAFLCDSAVSLVFPVFNKPVKLGSPISALLIARNVNENRRGASETAEVNAEGSSLTTYHHQLSLFAEKPLH